MKKFLIIFGVVVLLGIIVVVQLGRDSSTGTSVDAALVASNDLIEIVSASGRIQPETKVDITAEVNGEIIDLRVREGDRVEKGEILIVLDTVILRNNVDAARYRLNEVSARLISSQTALRQSEREFERQTQLKARELSSEAAFDDAELGYISAKASYEALQAQTDQAQASLDRELENFSKAVIQAPMTGIATLVDCEVGEIAAAQTSFTQGRTLVTISNLDVFEVEVEVDETEVIKVDVGQDATIEVDAYPDTTFAGQVVEIGNSAITTASQDQSTNFRVKVVFTDAQVELRPGMSATVDITTARRDDAVAVPFSAIVIRSYNLDSLSNARTKRDDETDRPGAGEAIAAEPEETDGRLASAENGDDGPQDLRGVFIIRGEQVEFAVVETGIADRRNIEITSGVQIGDTVVSGPYRVLRQIDDGDAVTISGDLDDASDNDDDES